MYKYITFLVLLMGVFRASAQELNCQVTVDVKPGVPMTATDKTVFEALQQSIYDFMNNTKWTEDVFEIEERIDCNIAVTILKKIGTDGFEAQMQVQSTRPVYKTSYNTVLFNHMDEDVVFSYVRNTQLRFSLDRHRNNLTSVLAFYAYMILGYDYDSFSLKGGTPHFNKAQQVVANASQAPEPGWKAGGYGDRNRYKLVDNALQGLFEPLRKCFYQYHRKGMDKMIENLEEARATMADALSLLNQIHQQRPGSMNVQSFLLGKQREIVNLFSQSPTAEKNEMINLLKRIDPSNSSEYQKISDSR